MNQQGSKKRTIISFGIALATALMSIYIQNYTDSKTLNDRTFEAKANPIEVPAFIETIN